MVASEHVEKNGESVMTRAMSRSGPGGGGRVFDGRRVAGADDDDRRRKPRRFEVISVDGNQLVVRLPEGTRELTVADDFRFTVNGQQMSVRELKPGMKGTATITTRTTVTPVTVTEVKNGTVDAGVGPVPSSCGPTRGQDRSRKGEIDKRGVKIMKDGKPAQLSGFQRWRCADRDQIITSKPPHVLTREKSRRLWRKPPRLEPQEESLVSKGPGGGVRLKAPASSSAPGSASAPASGSGSASTGAKTLPKTASSLAG